MQGIQYIIDFTLSAGNHDKGWTNETQSITNKTKALRKKTFELLWEMHAKKKNKTEKH